ncbi:MAG: trypsin-like serine protease [Burkholderiales bacterium]|nr:trypsin-like serine protease [Burkholderiales bacterium]
MKLGKACKLLLITVPSLGVVSCNSGYSASSASGLNQQVNTGSANQSKLSNSSSSFIPFVQNGEEVVDPVLNSMVPLLLITTSSGTSICTGTLLDNNTVLTAAHCVLKFDKKNSGLEYKRNDVVSSNEIMVYLSKNPYQAINLNNVGISGISQVANSYVVNNIYVHKYAFRSAEVGSDGFNINDGRDLNDLAILKLKTPATNLYKFPQLATSNPSSNSSALIAGYGVNVGGGVKLPDASRGNSGTLRKANSFFVRSTSEGRLIDVGGTVFSGGSSYYTKICQGDSGGPDFQVLNNNYILHGVHSFGDGKNCGGVASPSTSISVAAYNSWISEGYKTLYIGAENPIPNPEPTPTPDPSPLQNGDIQMSLQPCVINGQRCVEKLPLVVNVGGVSYINLLIKPTKSNYILPSFRITLLNSYLGDGLSLAMGQNIYSTCLLNNNLNNVGCNLFVRYMPTSSRKQGPLTLNYSYRDQRGLTVFGKYNLMY